jgi:hypothetical protein
MSSFKKLCFVQYGQMRENFFSFLTGGRLEIGIENKNYRKLESLRSNENKKKT